MATYAIGDVQGCFRALQSLLEKIGFNPQQDTLWFVGDLVNRGPQSSEVLRYIKNLEDRAITVLGNHDLSLLALSYGIIESKPKDTYQTVLEEPDAKELLHWLKSQSLMHFDAQLNYACAHAGIFPLWDINSAQIFASEVETILRSTHSEVFLRNMFGKEPVAWDPHLTGWSRLRFITNAFTRMRFCTLHGELNLTAKGGLSKCPSDCVPWFHYAKPAWLGCNIVFGHWAALNGETHRDSIQALDTGCVWGNCLTAFCLETKQRFQIECQ
ncbi:MAG TPA: symmetrical bis(5'-nucleosyl)-tetraphosphatase [Gammaproteobacteria bacterium]|nr:symmetrical bis(5'-nucleosyl)-tetraphosphatase [Gammaproteobacteria bacterium]